MNHRGETRELAALARPTIAVVTNAQREHQEFMRSVDEVADEHADVLRALPMGGTAVINADDAHAPTWREAAADRRIVEFGLVSHAHVRGSCDLRADGSELHVRTPAGSFDAFLHAPGRHMVANALAATAVAFAAGIATDAIARGLSQFRPVAGRLVARRTSAGQAVIDDTYNANPDSVRAAIDVLAAIPGEKWLVLGDMGEVGAQGPAFHREIGQYARTCGIDRLVASGELTRETVAAFGSGGEHVASVDELAARLPAMLPPHATLLVKGSRFMRMERVVAVLVGELGSGH